MKVYTETGASGSTLYETKIENGVEYYYRKGILIGSQITNKGEKMTSCDKLNSKNSPPLRCGEKITGHIPPTQFVYCGEDIKLEIKGETDSNLDDPIFVESQVEIESSDSKETIKCEIKQEVQEAEELQDPLSTERDSKDEITIDEFKIEDSV